jgi:hypothetical protein
MRGLDGTEFPFKLSQQAIASGWTCVYLMHSSVDQTKQVELWFRHMVYPGIGWRRFTRLPVIIGMFVLICALWLTSPFDRNRLAVRRFGRRLRGPEYVSPKVFVRRLRADGVGFLLKGKDFLGRRNDCFLRIPKMTESSGILIGGDPGMGKSVLLHQLLTQIAQRGERAIVLDNAGEFAQRHLKEGRKDIVLNAVDLRSPYWDLAKEITHDAEARTVARSMYPPRREETPFFADATQRLLAHLLRNRPSVEQLSDWLCKPFEIDKQVQGTELASLIDKQAGPQRAGILGTLAMFGDALRTLPKRSEASQSWNTSEWVKESDSWIFLTSTPMMREQLRPLQTCWIDLLILRLMNENAGSRKTWIILDELASLQNLPQLVTALVENRKSGNPLVIAFQGKSQLETIYGPIAETMLSVLATKVFFRTSEPRSSEWASNAIGKVEYEQLRESESTHPAQGKSRSEHIEFVTRPLVMPEEIAGLARLHAYVKHDNLVTDIVTCYLDLPCNGPAFIPRSSGPHLEPPEPPASPGSEEPSGNGINELLFR